MFGFHRLSFLNFCKKIGGAYAFLGAHMRYRPNCYVLTSAINVNTRQNGKNTYQGTLSLYMEKPVMTVINVNIKQNTRSLEKTHQIYPWE